ncbi:hypothetical protein KRR40_01125 [Niabella defluvii]|nr:hypothetical protein KRR40_01125 [Niabella sp. I65]
MVKRAAIIAALILLTELQSRLYQQINKQPLKNIMAKKLASAKKTATKKKLLNPTRFLQGPKLWQQ